MGRTKLPSQVSIHFWTVSSSSSVTKDNGSPSFKQGSSLWSNKGSVRGEPVREGLQDNSSLVSVTSDILLGSIISKSMLSSMFIRSSMMSSSLDVVVPRDDEEEPEQEAGVIEETERKVSPFVLEVWWS